MKLFALKAICDKILSNFPWGREEEGIYLTIHSSYIEISGSKEAISWVMNTHYISDFERRLLVVNVPDEDLVIE